MRSRRYGILFGALATAALAVPAVAGAATNASTGAATASPIKHVIVVLGENHTFDNVFATYQPIGGQQVDNLLAKGIVTAGGQPGGNAVAARQQRAVDRAPNAYTLEPPTTGPYATLPQPNTTYATGQPPNVPDPRFPANLPNAPFQITHYVPYKNAYVGDPIHRFYQMWQQSHQGANNLFTWTANTAGDDNGAIPPSPIHQGGLSMGYYNMAQGDAPIFRFLADNYAMSDNYHQAIMGGTGANHIAIGTADDAYYQNAAGQSTAPPANEIENPNPKPGTNNNFTQDGYAGGSYSNCSDPSQPGVSAILGYESTLPRPPFRGGDCANGAYYILNNYNPGYAPNGTPQTATFTVPIQKHLPTVADELNGHGVSWKYYGEGWNGGNPTPDWCGICDPFQYAQDYPAALKEGHIQDYSNFLQDVAGGKLPAVSFVKPGNDDGHPAYSTLSQFEGFTASVVTAVQAHPKLFASTAILVTFDEGGGYYDSGYIQPITFFGDGTRVPMMAISPFTKPGFISHSYNDHASIVKFIERNWTLPALSGRSWDNLPNPIASSADPYVPTNGPAVGDLWDLFDFGHARPGQPALPPAPPRVSGTGPAATVHNR